MLPFQRGLSLYLKEEARYLRLHYRFIVFRTLLDFHYRQCRQAWIYHISQQQILGAEDPKEY